MPPRKKRSNTYRRGRGRPRSVGRFGPVTQQEPVPSTSQKTHTSPPLPTSPPTFPSSPKASPPPSPLPQSPYANVELPEATDERFSRRKTLRHPGIDCSLCRSSLQDRFLGKLEIFYDHLDNKRAVHSTCLLTASALRNKRKKDARGRMLIFGFTLDDVIGEVNRSKTLKCRFCSKGPCGLGCFDYNCNMQYHVPCVLVQHVSIQSSFDFKESKSWCFQHREITLARKRRIHSQDKLKTRESLRKCVICESTEAIEIVTLNKWATIQCPHCGQLFHNNCLINLAIEVGPQLRCPNCKCFDENVVRNYEPKEQIDLPLRNLPRWERYSIIPVPADDAPLPMKKSKGKKPLKHVPTFEPVEDESTEYAMYSETALATKRVADRDNFSVSQCHKAFIDHCLRYGIPVSTNETQWTNYKDDSEMLTCAASNCLCEEGRTFTTLMVEHDTDEVLEIPANKLSEKLRHPASSSSSRPSSPSSPSPSPASSPAPTTTTPTPPTLPADTPLSIPPGTEWHFRICYSCQRNVMHGKCLLIEEKALHYLCLICKIRINVAEKVKGKKKPPKPVSNCEPSLSEGAEHFNGSMKDGTVSLKIKEEPQDEPQEEPQSQFELLSEHRSARKAPFRPCNCIGISDVTASPSKISRTSHPCATSASKHVSTSPPPGKEDLPEQKKPTYE